MPFPKAALTFFIVIAMIPAMREKTDLAALNPAYPRS
jgi:hypothetical protein